MPDYIFHNWPSVQSGKISVIQFIRNPTVFSLENYSTDNCTNELWCVFQDSSSSMDGHVVALTNGELQAREWSLDGPVLTLQCFVNESQAHIKCYMQINIFRYNAQTNFHRSNILYAMVNLNIELQATYGVRLLTHNYTVFVPYFKVFINWKLFFCDSKICIFCIVHFLLYC